MLLQCISHLVPSALKYALRSCSEQYNKKKKPAVLSSDHKCKQYMMYDYLLSELHLIFILKRKHFHYLISHVQGERFLVQAAHDRALHTLGWEKTLPLTTLEGYLGLKWEESFIRESPCTTPTWAVSSAGFLKVTHHYGVLDLFPDGVKVGSPWVLHTLDWQCWLKKPQVFFCAVCAFPASVFKNLLLVIVLFCFCCSKYIFLDCSSGRDSTQQVSIS